MDERWTALKLLFTFYRFPRWQQVLAGLAPLPTIIGFIIIRGNRKQLPHLNVSYGKNRRMSASKSSTAAEHLLF